MSQACMGDIKAPPGFEKHREVCVGCSSLGGNNTYPLLLVKDWAMQLFPGVVGGCLSYLATY